MEMNAYTYRKITVNQAVTGIRFRLGINESVMGLPRMAFVLLFGCIGLLAVGCIALFISCWSQRNKDKKYYSFSLLSQKPEQRKLFEDDDDVDETELFRTPIKGTNSHAILTSKTNGEMHFIC